MPKEQTEPKHYTIGNMLLDVSGEFQLLASNLADGRLTTFELLSEVSRVGNRAEYLRKRVEKLAMRDMWQHASKSAQEDSVKHVLDYPIGAI